jgi:hypothetical protein
MIKTVVVIPVVLLAAIIAYFVLDTPADSDREPPASGSPQVIVPTPSVRSATQAATQTEVAQVPQTPTTAAPDSTSAPSTATPLSTAAPASPTALTAEGTLQLVETELADLHSGVFEIVADFGNGTRSTSLFTFDLGDDATAMRLHMRTTYEGPSSSRESEYITVGSQSWERISNGPWSEVGDREGVWGQVQAFLPRIPTAPTASQPELDDRGMLRWHDDSRNVDVTLSIDPATGAPLEMQQIPATGGALLTVTYQGWNTDVEIDTSVVGL